MTTPNINNLIAIPYKKPEVENREEFLEIWKEKKTYVDRAGGGRNISYQEVRAIRRSEEYPWPEPEPGEGGGQAGAGEGESYARGHAVQAVKVIEELRTKLKKAMADKRDLSKALSDAEERVVKGALEISELKKQNAELRQIGNRI